MTILKIKDIKTDGGTQSRKKINNKQVMHYAEQMKEGSVFKPVVVFYDGKIYWLADGFHRLAAYKSNGVLEVEVEVKEGGQREALLFAIGANNDGRGLSMTFEENRNNTVMMLKDAEWGKWSDERIAKIVGVSRITVYRIRKKLEREGKIERKTSSRYVNKHGQESEMNVRSQSAPNEEEEEQAEDAPSDEPEITAEQAEVMQMSATVNKLAEENEKLKEQVALGLFQGNEFEKLDIQEMLEDLRKKNHALEVENKTLRESRDAYQYENAQLMKTVKSLKAKLKKAGLE